ncbi:MAG: hypothetical protein U0795_07115 [Pirellulales bacterium]
MAFRAAQLNLRYLLSLLTLLAATFAGIATTGTLLGRARQGYLFWAFVCFTAGASIGLSVFQLRRRRCEDQLARRLAFLQFAKTRRRELVITTCFLAATLLQAGLVMPALLHDWGPRGGPPTLRYTQTAFYGLLTTSGLAAALPSLNLAYQSHAGLTLHQRGLLIEGWRTLPFQNLTLAARLDEIGIYRLKFGNVPVDLRLTPTERTALATAIREFTGGRDQALLDDLID